VAKQRPEPRQAVDLSKANQRSGIAQDEAVHFFNALRSAFASSAVP
jgi:hypothetical protein